MGSIQEGGTRTSSNFRESMTSEIMLAISDPGKFRLDVKDQAGAVVLVGNGQTRWTYMHKKKEYTEEAEPLLSG